MVIGAAGILLSQTALSDDVGRGPHNARFHKGSFRDIQDVRKGLSRVG